MCEKFNECSSSNQENVVAPPLESLSTDSSSNNWNYDELNELRMKFISLLSDSSKDDDEETNKQTDSASHLKENKEVLLETNKPNSNVDMSKSKSNLFSMVSFKFLGFLELRLNILIVRLRFVSKIAEANKLIYKKYVLINGRRKEKNYLVQKKDILKCYFFFNADQINKRFSKFK